MNPILPGTTIEEISKSIALSPRALKVLEESAITTVGAFLNYFNKHRSFRDLPLCGSKLNAEFEKVYVIFRRRYATAPIIEETPERELNEAEIPLSPLQKLNLSVRACNICEVNGIKSLRDIVVYYQRNKTFLKLRNCGQKTEEELKQIVTTYYADGFYQENNEESPHSEILAIFDQLSPFKKAIVSKHKEYLLSALSVRARNGAERSFQEAMDVRDILEKVLDPFFDLSAIRNIGEKSAAELKEFQEQLGSFIKEISSVEDKELSKVYLKLVLNTTFKDLNMNTEVDFEQYLDKNNKIKVFHLIKFLIDFGFLFKSSERIVVNLAYCLNEKLHEFKSEEVGLTKERVRQIKMTLNEDLQERLSFIQNFNLEDLAIYDFNVEAVYKIIDNDLRDKINRTEDTKFTTQFIAKVIQMLLRNTYILLEDLEAGFGRQKKRAPSGCNYLVNRELNNHFPFNALLNDINSKLSERITEPYILYFEGYLFQFLENGNFNLLGQVREV